MQPFRVTCARLGKIFPRSRPQVTVAPRLFFRRASSITRSATEPKLLTPNLAREAHRPELEPNVLPETDHLTWEALELARKTLELCAKVTELPLVLAEHTKPLIETLIKALVHALELPNHSKTLIGALNLPKIPKPLEALELTKTLHLTKALKTLETLKTLELTESLEPLKTLEALSPLEALKSLEALELASDPREAANSSKRPSSSEVAAD